MRIFKRKTVCKNCGLTIKQVSIYGRLEWFHIRKHKAMNRCCVMMSLDDIIPIPVFSITEWSVAEPKECDKK